MPFVPPFSDTVKWLTYCQLYWAQRNTLNSNYEYLILFGQKKSPALQSDTRNASEKNNRLKCVSVTLRKVERCMKWHILNFERTQRIIAEDFRAYTCFANTFWSPKIPSFHVLLVSVVKEDTTEQRLQSSITLFQDGFVQMLDHVP